jgi:hypothetical protein
MRNAYKVLVEKPECKRQLGKSRRGWEENIKMILGKCAGKVWTGFMRLRTGSSGGFL